MGFVLDKVALEQFLLRVIQSSFDSYYSASAPFSSQSIWSWHKRPISSSTKGVFSHPTPMKNKNLEVNKGIKRLKFQFLTR
jgi:hypothetical protein